MVIVGDDCSLPGNGARNRRGLAGIVLVTKVPVDHVHGIIKCGAHMSHWVLSLLALGRARHVQGAGA